MSEHFKEKKEAPKEDWRGSLRRLWAKRKPENYTQRDAVFMSYASQRAYLGLAFICALWFANPQHSYFLTWYYGKEDERMNSVGGSPWWYLQESRAFLSDLFTVRMKKKD